MRQLENVVRCAIGLGIDPIRAEDLGIEERVAPSPLAEVEREKIARTFAETGGRMGVTAELLGMHRATLRRKMRRHGLSTERRAG